MNEEENLVKDWLIFDILAGNGYKTFAQHLINYDLFLTDDPRVAARMMPSRGCIEINRYFDDEALISVLIRHELLHFLLDHERNAIIDLAEENGLDPHKLTKGQYRELKQQVYSQHLIPGLEKYGPVSFTNVAGDWDLSQYYSKKDMDKIKNGLFYGTPMEGLVLELDHPEWLGLSYKELIHKIRDAEREARRAALQELSGDYLDEDHFVVDAAAEALGKADTKEVKKEISDEELQSAIKYELKKYDSWEDEEAGTNSLFILNWGEWETPDNAYSYEQQELQDKYADIIDAVVKKLKNKFKIKLYASIEDNGWIEFHWKQEAV